MERCTIRLPERQLDDVDRLVDRGEYPNRSEAIRAAVRDMLREERERTDMRPRAPREYGRIKEEQHAD